MIKQYNTIRKMMMIPFSMHKTRFAMMRAPFPNQIHVCWEQQNLHSCYGEMTGSLTVP